MYLQDEALVLIRTDYKERASRYVLLGRELGKIEVRMEGARNIHSKLSGHVEPVSLANVYLVKGRAGYKIIQTQLLRRYQFTNDTQWSFVWHFIETLIRLLPEEVVEKEVYKLVGEVFSHLESGGPRSDEFFDSAFVAEATLAKEARMKYSNRDISRGLWGYTYLRLLSALGYFPGNLLVSDELRRRAEAFLSMNFSNGIVEMEQHEEIISLVLKTVREILQTENRSSGYLKEVLKHETRDIRHKTRSIKL